MATDTLQRQARALGDPTRHAVFTWITERSEPVTVAMLQEQFGLNHTTIRQHLTQLCDCGLLIDSQAPPNGPGRPKRLYALAPNARGGWTHDGPYEQLSRLLLEVIRSGRSAHDVGFKAGKAMHGTIDRTGDALSAMTHEVARQGFAPRVEPVADGADLVLTNCPFAEAAEFDRSTVCALHRGLAEGLADAVGGVRVANLVANPPRHGNCRLQLTRTAKV